MFWRKIRRILFQSKGFLVVALIFLILLGLAPEGTWAYEIPPGYDAHDYQKLVAFLEQPNNAGKNGNIINPDGYDPKTPSTWWGVTWSSEPQKRVTRISWLSRELLSGSLDLSGCSALKELICGYNQLTSLDVSNCSSLEKLWCYSNDLTSLDLSNCTALRELLCSGNQLTSLNLTGCSSLQELKCHSNQLASLDLSGCSALQTLYCDLNQLTSLDLSNCSALQELRCDSNQLNSLNLSGCSNLQQLLCYSNQLTSLDLSNCTALKELNCAGNELTSLNLSGCSNLQKLACSHNQLASLDLSNYTALQYLNCSSNQLTSLILDGCSDMQELYCYSNQLTGLSLNGCQALIRIECYFNQLITLDLEGFSNLQRLYCYENQLTSLDLNGCSALQYLHCYSNKLINLNLNGCLNLQELKCYSNQLISLDLSYYLALRYLSCYENQLTNLNLSGCSALQYLDCNNNQLTSLILSECSALRELYCKQNLLTSLDLSGCSVLQYIYCERNQLTSLNLSGCSKLDTLYCYSNQLTSLDLSDCPALQYLYCNSNQLTNLNLERCLNLKELKCYFNQLTSLDLSDCQALKYFYCDSNQLTSLDLSSCPDLRSFNCSYNKLTTLILNGCSKLYNLYCYVNELTSLDLRDCQALMYLQCNSNDLANLDLSNCPALLSLICHFNQLTSLDLSGCSNLNTLSCYSNRLAILNLRDCQALKYLYCERNRLTSLDLSGCPALQELTCDHNFLTFADLPLSLPVSGGKYIYSPQADIRIGTVGKIFVGEEIDLSAEAQIDGTIFTWYYNVSQITPTTSINGVFTFDQSFAGKTIYCLVTNPALPDLTLETNRVLVVTAVNITGNPEDTTVVVGATPTFTVTIEPTDAGEGWESSYQWQLSKDGGSTWEDIPGATNASYTTPAVVFDSNGHLYRCKVTSTNGLIISSIYSDPATLSVVAEPSISTHPQDTIVAEGASATFSVVAEAADINEGGVLSYQWELSTDGGKTWTDIDGAIKARYTISPVIFADNGNQYKCKVTNSKNGVNSEPVDSGPATLYVVAKPSITKQPGDQIVKINNTATFTIVAEAADANEGGVLSYQWELSTDGGSNWSDIPGATDPNYTTPPVIFADNGHQYRCKVTNTRCDVSLEVDSEPATLYVVANPSITKQPGDQIVKINDTATFTIVAEAADAGEGGTLSYQWQCSTDGGETWVDIDGATNASYTIPAVTLADNGNQYRCIVTNTKNGISSDPVDSKPATLYLVAKPSIINHPQTTTVNIGTAVTFTIVAGAADEGGVLSYQWELSTDGGSTWEDITGATDPSYTTPPVTFADNGNQYRCKVTNTRCDVSLEVDSEPATLYVVANPSITKQPGDQIVKINDTATFTVEVEAADANEGGVLSCQWELSTDGGSNWNDIAGATDPSYTIPAVTSDHNGYQYKCKVTNTKNGVSSDPVYSDAATLTVIWHRIVFIKPTNANDINNPVNINSGSLVLARVYGDMSTVETVTIKVDDNPGQPVTLSGNTIYYLLPANLDNGEHTITIKLMNKAGQEIAELVTFYWQSYRRGFGFGRFDFGEAPAGE